MGINLIHILLFSFAWFELASIRSNKTNGLMGLQQTFDCGVTLDIMQHSACDLKNILQL